jgi:hypothetical protein
MVRLASACSCVVSAEVIDARISGFAARYQALSLVAAKGVLVAWGSD